MTRGAADAIRTISTAMLINEVDNCPLAGNVDQHDRRPRSATPAKCRGSQREQGGPAKPRRTSIPDGVGDSVTCGPRRWRQIASSTRSEIAEAILAGIGGTSTKTCSPAPPQLGLQAWRDPVTLDAIRGQSLEWTERE